MFCQAKTKLRQNHYPWGNNAFVTNSSHEGGFIPKLIPILNTESQISYFYLYVKENLNFYYDYLNFPKRERMQLHTLTKGNINN